MNPLRFRDFLYPVAKPERTFRILAIGDSFTRGGGIDFDDTHPKRLERYLNYYAKDRGAHDEVMNLGVAGTSTPEQFEILERHLLALDPDLVILSTA